MRRLSRKGLLLGMLLLAIAVLSSIMIFGLWADRSSGGTAPETSSGQSNR